MPTNNRILTSTFAADFCAALTVIVFYNISKRLLNNSPYYYDVFLMGNLVGRLIESTAKVEAEDKYSQSCAVVNREKHVIRLPTIKFCLSTNANATLLLSRPEKKLIVAPYSQFSISPRVEAYL
jgi:hypothetical protein